ncbi:histidine phosphatase family protein [Paenibacillus sedimenti]|uniref:Histidine phosphatase family protein n=1 Tax=Paenibacillus sedimenti TaxID=2770274 RepID=A0A926QLI3_9BACL|nr:histidine phosphatase family protein [Paenibacillus sedimenti]MBD0382873.1 histidine phosphatase family protein [Paenibacillus sedimenti]
MSLYVVRHGETEWNYENRVCGTTDIRLTNRGIEQAKDLAQLLRKKQINIIISSPLCRALNTAEIISKEICTDYIVDQRLTEQDYGVFEGSPHDNKEFLEAKLHFANKLSGGESILQVVQRIFNLLDDIKEKYRNHNVLLVAHGGVCRVINAYFKEQSNEEFYYFHIGNCELKEYNF